jgi:hypothetical protein
MGQTYFSSNLKTGVGRGRMVSDGIDVDLFQQFRFFQRPAWATSIG